MTSKYKGIVLAGGSGSRLHPITMGVSKQLLPIYDKPMIYYPLSTLLNAGIREVLFITTPNDQPLFKHLLGDGSKLGCRFEYQIQSEPNGLAQAFVIGKQFIGKDKVALILGDNIFFGHGLTDILKSSLNQVKTKNNAVVFGYSVKDPERYGVIKLIQDIPVKIVEKPSFD